MNIEEYKRIREVPTEDCSFIECMEADNFVKVETLKKLDRMLGNHYLSDIIKAFVSEMCEHYFGTIEIDEFLLKFGAYPDWI